MKSIKKITDLMKEDVRHRMWLLLDFYKLLPEVIDDIIIDIMNQMSDEYQLFDNVYWWIKNLPEMSNKLHQNLESIFLRVIESKDFYEPLKKEFIEFFSVESILKVLEYNLDTEKKYKLKKLLNIIDFVSIAKSAKISDILAEKITLFNENIIKNNELREFGDEFEILLEGIKEKDYEKYTSLRKKVKIQKLHILLPYLTK
jgi:hypothetical protein